MNNLLLSFSFILIIIAGNFSCSKSGGMDIKISGQDSGFVIYFYDHSETSKFNTHNYEYDSSWMNFLNNASLSDVKISDNNIEWYDWDKQQLRLSSDGKGIFTKFLKRTENGKPEYRSWEKLFIVTLNSKRLYAGRIELRYSEMAIQYPIISYGENGDNYPKNFDDKPILWLIPYLVSPPKGAPNEGGKLTVGNEEIRSYFEKIGKIK